VTDDYKIYVDGARPATLNDGASALPIAPPCRRLSWLGTDCPLSRKCVRRSK
jgi:hypothetical protein